MACRYAACCVRSTWTKKLKVGPDASDHRSPLMDHTQSSTWTSWAVRSSSTTSNSTLMALSTMDPLASGQLATPAGLSFILPKPTEPSSRTWCRPCNFYICWKTDTLGTQDEATGWLRSARIRSSKTYGRSTSRARHADLIQYAASHDDCSDAVEAASIFYRHREFLIATMLTEDKRLHWSKTRFYRHLHEAFPVGLAVRAHCYETETFRTTLNGFE